MTRLTSLLAIGAFLLAVPLLAARPDPLEAAKQMDALLARDWSANHVKPNPPASDEVMVRRLYLDIAGRIPTAREAESFLNSKDPNKRQKLIDRLLGSEGYVQNYFNFWADILRAQSSPALGSTAVGYAYTQFIKDSLRTNKPYDKFVRELVGANGKLWNNGAIGYYLRDRGMPLDNMATTVRIFLGTRIECAQCHNHPFDRWTQKQFYGMAAFTYGVNTYESDKNPGNATRKLLGDREQEVRRKMKGNNDPALKEELNKVRKEGSWVTQAINQAINLLQYTNLESRERELLLPHDYKYPDAAPKALVTPAAMMGQAINCPPGGGGNTQEAYAAWMTSGDNPRFTTVVVNRLWKRAFGLALYEPLDELMDNSTPMIPDVERFLERFMIASGYDTKALLKAIFNTRAYQAQVSREEVAAGDTYHFTGPALRRMTAEQIWDSFVALINPTPDMGNNNHDYERDRLRSFHKLNDAFEQYTPAELLQGAEVAGVMYLEQSERFKALQKEYDDARAGDEKAKMKVLGKEIDELQYISFQSVWENMIVPAVKQLAARHGATDAGEIDYAGIYKKRLGALEVVRSIPIPGYEEDAKTQKEHQAQKDNWQRQLADEAAYYGIPEMQQAGYFQFSQQLSIDWLRAAEIPSPAPRGHYLREFGQSDRETVENGNHDASVPQALALMNGALLPGILNRYSQLMLSLGRAKFPDDQVNAIYLTLLSRKPTEKEKEAWQHAQDLGLKDPKDLIYALLNTQQFIFVQ